MFFLIIMLFILNWGGEEALAAGPHLFLSPASGNYFHDFNIEVRIDTGGQEVGGADIYLEFPKNMLRATEVTEGTTFSQIFSSINNEEGGVRISAYFSYADSGRVYNGADGLIAVVNFLPLSLSGSALLTFKCSAGSTADSNIIENTTSRDIIVCSENNRGSYSLSMSAGNPTANGVFSPTATPGISAFPVGVGSDISSPSASSPSSSSSPLSSRATIPVTGSIVQTSGFIVFGIIVILTGIILLF